MRSSNPVFRSIERSESYSDTSQATYTGIISKTGILFAVAVVTGFIAINYLTEVIYPLLVASLIGGFISVIVASFSARLAPVFSIVYALCQGVFLAVITTIAEIFAPGAGLTAIMGTAVLFLVMLFLYSSRTIRVTPKFRRVMYTILFSILVFSILFGVLFGFGILQFSGNFFGIAIAISIFLIIYGALMLTLDFDRAEAIVSSGADKRYEWQVSLGLMVTIIWIYVEILRLIIILAARRD